MTESREPEQLGFGFDKMFEQQETAHLPSAMDEGITLYRAMLEKNHQAMLAADVKAAMAIRKEADRLARKLNNDEPGILAGPDASGYVLMRESAAPAGTVPMWGQKGDFKISVGTMPVRIEMDGMIGVAAGLSVWPGFSAHVVEPDKPFLSETGYRHFAGYSADLVPGITPDAFAREAIASFIKGECKGKLRQVKAEYRGRD